MSRPHTPVRRIALALGTVLALAVTGLTLVTSPATAADRRPDVASPKADESCSSPVQGYRLSQTFIAGRTGDLDRVDLYAWFKYDSGVGQSLTVQITDVINGEPGTRVLAEREDILSGTPLMPDRKEYHSVTFAQPAPVTAGTQYALVMIHNRVSTGWTFFWCGSRTDSYPGGQLFSGPPDRQVARTPNSDQSFRTYVRGPQSVTFENPGTQTFGTTPRLAASTDSQLPPIFTSSSPEVCSISPSGELTFGKTGSCSINADQPGDEDFSPATTVTHTFKVQKGIQTLDFPDPGPQKFDTSPTLRATSDSGLTPAFTSATTRVCTIATGGRLTILAAGTCTITATQNGDDNHHAASPVTRSVRIDRAAITLTTKATRPQRRKIKYTATVRSATTARPLAGIRVTSNIGRKATCTAITNSRGIATCTTRAKRIKKRFTYTSTTTATGNYLGTTVTKPS